MKTSKKIIKQKKSSSRSRGRPKKSRIDLNEQGYRWQQYERDKKKEKFPPIKIKVEGEDLLSEGEKRFFRVKNFIETYCSYPMGKEVGQPFILQPWEEEITGDIFGSLNGKGERQYRRAYISLPRKCGKTSFISCIVLFFLVIESENEHNMSIVSVARNVDQAALIFNSAASMVRANPHLRKILAVVDYTKRIINKRTHATYKVLSSEAGSAYGLNPKLIVFDEVHNQPNDQLWNALERSQGALSEPLMIAISTAGWDRESLCYRLYKYSKNLIEGRLEDSTFYSKIYEVGEEEDWKSEENWRKANPAAHRDFDELRSSFQRALNMPVEETVFKNQYLNQWTSTKSRWISMEMWDARGKIPVEPENLKGLPVWVGIDLAAKSDLCACVFLAKDKEETFWVYPMFWIPEDSIISKEKSDQVKYSEWKKNGFIKSTPGDIIDHRRVEEDIFQSCTLFEVKVIGTDPYHSEIFDQDLMKAGFEVIAATPSQKDVNQGYQEMENQIKIGKLQHGGHPVLRWCMDNVAVDPIRLRDGLIWLSKSSATARIDGIIALGIAFRMYQHRADAGKSVYDQRGLIFLGDDLNTGEPSENPLNEPDCPRCGKRMSLQPDQSFWCESCGNVLPWVRK